MTACQIDSPSALVSASRSKIGFSGSPAFGYSYANQLTSITQSGSYTGAEVRLVYDGLGRLAQRRNASNQVTASCHYAGSRLTDLLEGNSEVTFQWGAGEPLSQIQGSSTYWYVPGSLGDPMSFNRHLYTDANPVDYSDPSGLQTTQHRPCDNKKDNPCGDDYHFIFASGPALLAFVHARPLIAKAFPKEPPANIQTGASAAGWAFGRVMDRLAGTFYCFIYDAIACGPDTPQPPEHIPDNGAIQPDFGGWHTRYVR